MFKPWDDDWDDDDDNFDDEDDNEEGGYGIGQSGAGYSNAIDDAMNEDNEKTKDEEEDEEKEEDEEEDEEEESEEGEEGEDDKKKDKDEKDDKKKGKEEKEEVKGKVSNIKLIRTARQLDFPPFIMPFVCPTCKQKSIFSDKIMKNGKRVTINIIKASLGCASATRSMQAIRFVCLNPKCKSYYPRTGVTMSKSLTGDGLETHENWFFIPR